MPNLSVHTIQDKIDQVFRGTLENLRNSSIEITVESKKCKKYCIISGRAKRKNKDKNNFLKFAMQIPSSKPEYVEFLDRLIVIISGLK